jgi:hypothetical protein
VNEWILFAVAIEQAPLAALQHPLNPQFSLKCIDSLHTMEHALVTVDKKDE